MGADKDLQKLEENLRGMEENLQRLDENLQGLEENLQGLEENLVTTWARKKICGVSCTSLPHYKHAAVICLKLWILVL